MTTGVDPKSANINSTATILKLSTQKCKDSCKLPIKTDYWKPVNQITIESIEEAFSKVGKRQMIKLVGFKKRMDGSPGKTRWNSTLKNNRVFNMIKLLEKSFDSDVIANCEKMIDCYIKLTNNKSEAVNQEFETIDGITVKLESEEKNIYSLPGAVVRKFSLKKGDKIRLITQIDYPKWEDFSASSTSSLEQLRKLTTEIHGDNNNPIKVHCRAGVGRTGTFVAYSAMMKKIESLIVGDECESLKSLDPESELANIIADIRSQRDWQMVQTSVQANQIVDTVSYSIMKILES